jgi:hypothetical protein
MPSTIRQQILDTLKTKLQGISIAGGYQTNLGSSVHEWRSSPFMREELPALIWRDLDEPIEEHTRFSSRHQRSLHIQVEIVGEGATSPAQYRKMLADVEKAIKAGQLEDGTWWAGTGGEGLALRTRPRMSRLVVEQESLKIAGGFYECFIDYVTRDFDQYYA